MNTAETNALTLDMLEEQRRETKQVIAEHQKQLVAIEQSMLNHPDAPPAVEKGTVDFGPCKVTFALTRKYDQARLEAYRVANNVTPENWPFKMEWKEDGKAISFLRDRYPDFIASIENEALTVKGAKPAFKTKEAA